MTHSIAELEKLLQGCTVEHSHGFNVTHPHQCSKCRAEQDARNNLRDLAPSLAAELLAIKQRERWIPTSELLPELGVQVIVHCVGGLVCDSYRLTAAGPEYPELASHTGKWDVAETNGLEEYEVTHWRPLPAPPASNTKAKEI